jgi:hypothetical protein
MKTKIVLATLAVIGSAALHATAQVTVSTAVSGLAEPYNVVEDAAGNIYVSDSANDRIVRIDASTQAASTLAGVSGMPGADDGPNAGFDPAHFNNPQGLLAVSLGGTNGLLVADSGNNLIRFVRFNDGFTVTLAGNTNPPAGAADAAGTNASFNVPVGLEQDGNGNVYIADEFDNAIRVINLNDPAFGVTNLIVTGTTFHHPNAVAYGGSNQLWISDSYNNAIKLITLSSPTSGNLTTYLGSNSHQQSPNFRDNAFGPVARFSNLGGLMWVNGVGLLISDTGNNAIRLATNNPVYGATNYSVTTYAGTPGTPGFANGNALSATFNQPFGLCNDPINNAFLVGDLANNAIRRIQNGPPLPPVPTPSIGWVEFKVDPTTGQISSVLHTGSPFVFNNDAIIAIAPNTTGTQVHYTDGPTPANPLVDTIPNPSQTTGSTPAPYSDGMSPDGVVPLSVQQTPDLTIKAIGFQSGRQNSSIVSARFQFQTATPSIVGDNAAQFTLTDITTNALMYYTTDGTDPTNGPPSIGPIRSGSFLSLVVASNLTLKVVAFKDNYENSSVVTKVFSISNFVANTISFGFASGEASSDFVAAPGQTFYAPVTLATLPNTVMYGLQFNLTVNPGGTNPGPALAAAPTPFGFTSMLVKPIPGVTPVVYETIPPAMFDAGQAVPNPVTLDGSTNFSSLLVTNNSINLLGVGWVERAGKTNLYDTTKQTLITYSMAHDDMFPNPSEPNDVIVGGYAFTVPTNATDGQTYQIQIGRPSATSDGIGAPGSSVFISAPTNGSLAAGAINAIKQVTVGSRKYLVGNVYPFGWFNAGDFGNSNLQNADVEQVFEAAIYDLNAPPPGSDFFDAMDSCGNFGAPDGNPSDPNYGDYTNANNAPLTAVQQNALFDGNDTNINQVAFGDGVLDVCDVYVTFRRSLDTNNLVWFQRFWTNGVRVATANYAPVISPNSLRKLALAKNTAASITNSPAVNFTAGDYLAGAGQTVQIPVTAAVFGPYPLRVAMLNISVVPLDGSPAVATPISFSPGAALGAPYMTDSDGPNNFAAAWLNSAIAGISNNATIGTLTVTIPANATSLSAYAIHFDHVSASPNGLASFPKHTQTGLITLSSRASSSYNDGIPDSWRLRWFGTVNNQLSVSNACPSGDGVNNWMKYVAGVDPNTPDDFPSLNPNTPPPAGAASSIYWPTVSGKQYAILSSASLFPGNWSTNAIVTGNGATMEYDDHSGGAVKFYRVLILP